MTDELITSRENRYVKLARAVRDGREPSMILIEGERICQEALRTRHAAEVTIVSQRFGAAGREREILEELDRNRADVRRVTDEVFKSVADTRTPQGILIIAPRPSDEVLDASRFLEGPALVTVLHSIANPSNAGAIVRTAEAAGASAVIATAGSTDLYSAKAIRSSMGSALRLQIWQGASLADVVRWCERNSMATVAAAPSVPLCYSEFDWRAPVALVLGAEAAGLSDDDASLVRHCVCIPMHTPVESLNVGAAAAVLLFEAARQRRMK